MFKDSNQTEFTVIFPRSCQGYPGGGGYPGQAPPGAYGQSGGGYGQPGGYPGQAPPQQGGYGQPPAGYGQPAGGYPGGYGAPAPPQGKLSKIQQISKNLLVVGELVLN